MWTLAFISNLKGTFGGQCLELDLNHKNFSPLDTILQELEKLFDLTRSATLIQNKVDAWSGQLIF